VLSRLKLFLSRRSVPIAAVVLLQLLLLFLLLIFCSARLPFFGFAMRLFTLYCACYLISRRDNPAYKLAWVALMLLFPALGGAVYLIGGSKRLPKKLKKQLLKFSKSDDRQQLNASALSELAKTEPDFYPISLYIMRAAGLPPVDNTDCCFFATGGELFDTLCEKLKSAESFIFLEYFIVSSGALFDRIDKILTEKLKQGIEVRIMYDDLGCIDLPGKNQLQELKEKGAKLLAFNRCRPHLTPAMNYRDHRKICVIDGDVGFCGGANISDEYVNLLPTLSHWKDTGVMLCGRGVWNLALLFLNLWDFSSGGKSDFGSYLPNEDFVGSGFVQPFGDNPLDELCVAENVLLMALMRAKQYFYITTPYLIPDSEMINALCTAALSGVDVRIITPAVPDKWYVHALTQSHYRLLLNGGVRIFEYTPGFIHSKQFICDDRFAVVGTANMDYRSFYLHFESAVCLYGCDAIAEVKRDMIETLGCCREITVEDTFKFPLLQRMTAAVLKPFAPLF